MSHVLNASVPLPSLSNFHHHLKGHALLWLPKEQLLQILVGALDVGEMQELPT